MSSHLSQADVNRLLQEPSPSARAEIAGKLALEIDSPKLTETELNLAQEIVRLMARDVEVSVRHSLAENLRKAIRLPHDVAVKLANDVESVALPVLENSLVLTDDDLVSIVRNSNSSSKHEAIAGRVNVSIQVSDALIASAGENAVLILMGNATAKISEQGYNKAIDRFKHSDPVKEAMVKRSVLPITIAERLTAIVSERLKDYLVSHHELPASVASDLVMQSRERTIINMSSGSSDQEVEKLVLQMYRNNRLTPSVVLRALCMGDLTFFEMSLAVMAGVHVSNARILIHDAGRLGLKTLYEKTGLPMRLLPAIRVALDVVHETEMDGGNHDLERYRARVIERVLTQFEDFSEEDVEYLLAKLGDIVSVASVVA